MYATVYLVWRRRRRLRQNPSLIMTTMVLVNGNVMDDGSCAHSVSPFMMRIVTHCLDEGDNPWNIALHRPLYLSQIIGFRWMLDRHRHGGGLVADKVGCGKVVPVLAKDLIHRPIRRRISS